MPEWIEAKYAFNKMDVHKLDKVMKNIADAGATVKRYFKEEMKTAKRKVKPELHKGHGVVKNISEYSPRRRGKRTPGTYKKSLILNDVKVKGDDSQFILQVGGKKGEYRLSHLLEHGHKVYRRKENGKNVYLPKKSKSIPHIKVGQDYINKVADATLHNAIEDVLRHAKR